MIRKVAYLVRTAIRTESIEAVVESSVDLDSVKPQELWSCLILHGVVPYCEEEQDTGINVFLAEYDPSRDVQLPIVRLSALTRYDLPPLDQRRVRGARIARKRRHTVRKAVSIARDREHFEVKRMIVEASAVEAVETADSDTLWWHTPQILVEEDEHLPGDFTIEIASYDAHQHKHLPFVFIGELPVVEEVPPPETFLLGWQPSSFADTKDGVESRRVRGIVGADPNQCYFNARKVLRALPEYSSASYVEGYAVSQDGEIVEHGWLITDGKVVDPTLPDDDTSYFPGLEFGGRDRIRTFLQTEWGSRCESHPFHWAFGGNGFGSPSFRKAFERARDHLLARFGVQAMKRAAIVRGNLGLPWDEQVR